MSDEENSLKLGADEENDAEKFRLMIEERAYYKAEQRGFANGHELDDWLEAEQEVRNQCRDADAGSNSS